MLKFHSANVLFVLRVFSFVLRPNKLLLTYMFMCYAPVGSSWMTRVLLVRFIRVANAFGMVSSRYAKRRRPRAVSFFVYSCRAFFSGLFLALFRLLAVCRLRTTIKPNGFVIMQSSARNVCFKNKYTTTRRPSLLGT